MEETMSDVFVLALIANEALMDYVKNPDTEEVRIYAAATLGEGALEGGNPPAPDLPYIVWNELPSTPLRVVEETSNAQHRFFTFHVYDTMGSLTTINTMLRLVRDVWKGLAPFATSEEGRCSESTWLGLSGFIPDPTYNATVRYGSARLQASE